MERGLIVRASQARDIVNNSLNESDLDQTFETIKQAAKSGMCSVSICGPYKDVEVKHLESLGYKVYNVDDQLTRSVKITW